MQPTNFLEKCFFFPELYALYDVIIIKNGYVLNGSITLHSPSINEVVSYFKLHLFKWHVEWVAGGCDPRCHPRFDEKPGILMIMTFVMSMSSLCFDPGYIPSLFQILFKKVWQLQRWVVTNTHEHIQTFLIYRVTNKIKLNLPFYFTSQRFSK